MLLIIKSRHRGIDSFHVSVYILSIVMTKNLTIRDISKYARVSTATVSRVLANSPKVKTETRQRVLEIITKYGYEPNHIARSLSMKRTSTIGLVVEAIANPFFVEVAQAVESELTRANLAMLLMSTNWDSEKELASIRTLLRNRVDGVLLTPMSIDSPAVKLLRRWGVPFVLINIDAGDESNPSVSTDNFRGGFLAAQALLKSQAVSFVCLQGFPHQSTFSRIEGFKAAIDEASLNRNIKVRVIPNIRTFDEGYDVVQSLLSFDMLASESLGVFATNDDVALGVLASLCDHGVRIPQQVAVVGYDDIPVAQRFQIPLTTIAQPMREMGRIAAKELIEQLDTAGRKPKSHILLPRLVQRASTVRVNTQSTLVFNKPKPDEKEY